MSTFLLKKKGAVDGTKENFAGDRSPCAPRPLLRGLRPPGRSAKPPGDGGKRGVAATAGEKTAGFRP